MSAPFIVDLGQFKRSVQDRHIQQLRTMDAVEEPDSALAASSIMPGKDELLGWIAAQKQHIDDAKKCQATEGDELDWNVTLLNFFESAAMYLRDTRKVKEAIIAAKKGEHEKARMLLHSSQGAIDEIASAMGMDFVVLCDLVNKHPVGAPHWNGAFCGMFFPKEDGVAPFMNIAFKGTNNVPEVLVDIHCSPVAPEGDCLFGDKGVQVHQGFYTGLFGKFRTPTGQEETPFQLILSGVMEATEDSGLKHIPLHITGHSLGGAYGSLCYAEMVRLLEDSTEPEATSPFPDTFELRNLLTFGGPRVASGRLADLVHMRMKPARQRSWRVCAEGDPVATIPPVTQFGFSYLHLDHGVRISREGPWCAMETEMPNSPLRPPMRIVKHMWEDHAVTNYYKCVVKALGK